MSERYESDVRAMSEQCQKSLVEAKAHKHEKDVNLKRRKLWTIIVKKEIPKASRVRVNRMGTTMQTLKKVAQTCQRNGNDGRRRYGRRRFPGRDCTEDARTMTKEEEQGGGNPGTVIESL